MNNEMMIPTYMTCAAERASAGLVLFAGAPGNSRRGADRESEGHRVDQRHYRLSKAYDSNRPGSELGYEKYIDDCE